MEETTIQKEVIHFACPNCGSTCVHKSMGGKAENVAAVFGAKLIKKAVLGDNSKYVRGEGKLINESVPFQQTCDYCHYTFHASQSQIDNGKYSMNKRTAGDLHSSYNKKLQMVKDKEVSGIKNKASQKMKKVISFYRKTGYNKIVHIRKRIIRKTGGSKYEGTHEYRTGFHSH